INGDLALTMGNVILVDKQGQTTMVDKSWAFKKDEQGQLRIVLHHSSLPYQP
ncbi:phosphoribosyl-AMP cyclohydrolase, partial [Vibrio metschnikovii]|nr:phosphoribosyl-AMP cyclohydrolase [Vibrio metschnikovii]